MNKRIAHEHYKRAFKTACERYFAEKLKAKGLSALKVCEQVNKEFGTFVSHRTVLHYVNKLGLVGVSPGKRGPPNAGMSTECFRILLRAFESYKQINQINAEGAKNTQKNMIPVVNAVLHRNNTSDCLYRQLMSASEVDWKASVQTQHEERRIRWTTYQNLAMWFSNWKNVLLELGFGEMDGVGPAAKFVIPDDQLGRILNLDETSISFDGSTGRTGGRPAVTFSDPRLPSVGKPSSKSSSSLTMIAGSTALGEGIPPHFQFPSRAQTEERQKFKYDTLRYLKGVRGCFGNKDAEGAPLERTWPSTLGMNEKGGMDECEFSKYLFNSIVPLYPDVLDIPGKRVMIKVDSGPGRLNTEMHAKLRCLGFYLYPGVPNTTHVTQETDQSYGLFKSIVRKNLEQITADRLSAKKKPETKNVTLNFPPSLIGLLVFGGVDEATGVSGYEDAFAAAFAEEKNREAWAKVGAAPFTQACLKHPGVRHDTLSDPMGTMYEQIQRENTYTCAILDARMYEGFQLRATINCDITARRTITVPNTRQRVQSIATSNGHGERYFVTGGDHLTSDDGFKAAELANRLKQVEAMEKDKAYRQACEEKERAAVEILEHEPPFSVEQLKGNQLKILLDWYGIANKDRGKSVGDKRVIYLNLKVKKAAPIQYAKWTEEDEERLTALKEDEIELGDTALGRMKDTAKKLFHATTTKLKLSPEERREFAAELLEEANAEEPDSDDSTVFEGDPWARK